MVSALENQLKHNKDTNDHAPKVVSIKSTNSSSNESNSKGASDVSNKSMSTANILGTII